LRPSVELRHSILCHPLVRTWSPIVRRAQRRSRMARSRHRGGRLSQQEAFLRASEFLHFRVISMDSEQIAAPRRPQACCTVFWRGRQEQCVTGDPPRVEARDRRLGGMRFQSPCPIQIRAFARSTARRAGALVGDAIVSSLSALGPYHGQVGTLSHWLGSG
jgi:hypothetical protein